MFRWGIGLASAACGEGSGAALQADDKRGLRWGQPHASMEKRSMKHYAGLDVSVKEASVCIVRGLLRNFGPKVGVVGLIKFEERTFELVDGMPDLAEASLLGARRTLREQTAKLHRRLLSIVREDDACRQLMTIPGVGPIVSLAFTATIDIPARFKSSKAVGSALGLTPIVNQSGESNRIGRISQCGDGMMRTLLYEAAQVMLTRTIKWSWLKAWAMNVAKRRGKQNAIVALARRLAVIMHRMWRDGTQFRWTKEPVPAAS